MKFTPLAIISILAFILPARTVSGQCHTAPPINFSNPSFEGTAPAPNVTPAPWTECLAGQTPDTQPGCWGVTLAPANGNSYVGLVAQPSTNWQEGAAQALSSPFVAGVTYTFTVDLANSSTRGGGIVPGCAECQVWAGFSACDKNTLLWSSGNITPYNTWTLYTVTFTPTQNFTWCMFQVHSLGCSSDPYILVDNISPITPTNLVATMQPESNDNCAGDSTGKAVVHVNGLHPPFTYTWNTPLIVSDSVLNNVPAGTYTVTVTDANTCTSTASVVITQPAAFTASATPTATTCFGGTNGAIAISHSGGIAPLSYSWSNGATTQNIANLASGTYNLTSTDAHGCIANVTSIVAQPPSMTIAGNITNAGCVLSNGSITASASGGTAPYNYNWNTTPAQTGAVATNLGPGQYIVSVTDVNSCTASQSFTVTQPVNTLTGNLAVTNVLCYGQNTGALNAVISGGSPGYTYAWSGGSNSASVNNLAIGTYSVTVHDQLGCPLVLDTTVTQPLAPLGATITENDVKCFGQSTGNAKAIATGGTVRYAYNWNSNPVQNTDSAYNLPAGNYTITVTDANQCTFTANTTINQPAAPLALTEAHVNVLCFGAGTGTAAITANGGTSPYAYAWNTNPVQTTDTISNLAAGTYTATVVDANQCIAGISSIISQPAAPLQATSTIQNVLCNGYSTGSINVAVAGGTASYNYQWSAGNSSRSSITNAPAGNYTTTVTDANNCTLALNMQITQPTALMLGTTVTSVSCPNHGDGKIDAVVSGATPPYAYAWSNGQIKATDTLLNGGTYNLLVTDSNGCTITADNILVSTLPGVMIEAQVTNILCFPLKDGAIDINATSTFLPLQYSWSNGDTTANLNNIDTGFYQVTVTDAHHCTAESGLRVGNDSIFTMSATPGSTTIKLGESVNIQLSAFGGNFNTITWSPSEALSCSDCDNPVSTPVADITYYVNTVDQHGCTAHDEVQITVTPAYEIFIPNAFTPNGDGTNDYFEVYGNKEAWKYFAIEIFDRWGEKVLESNDMNFEWDGQFRGKPAAAGVYVYEVHLVYMDNHTEKMFKGSITLIR